MVKCENCKRHFEVVHIGQTFDLCDMDCFVETIYEPFLEIDCDFYETDTDDNLDGYNSA